MQPFKPTHVQKSVRGLLSYVRSRPWLAATIVVCTMTLGLVLQFQPGGNDLAVDEFEFDVFDELSLQKKPDLGAEGTPDVAAHSNSSDASAGPIPVEVVPGQVIPIPSLVPTSDGGVVQIGGKSIQDRPSGPVWLTGAIEEVQVRPILQSDIRGGYPIRSRR